MLNKSVINTAPREFIDKKIYFTKSQVRGDSNDKDIYIWGTSAPDELYPIDKSLRRSDSLLGIFLIGKRMDK